MPRKRRHQHPMFTDYDELLVEQKRAEKPPPLPAAEKAVLDREWDCFLVQWKLHAPKLGKSVLFTTDAERLPELFLSGFSDNPTAQRFHSCQHCLDFIRRFGGLAVVDPCSGEMDAAFWRIPPGVLPGEYYQATCQSLRQAVQQASITGVFFDSSRVLGQPGAGDYTHFYASNLHWHHDSPAAIMAEKRQDFELLQRTLGEFNTCHVETALALVDQRVLAPHFFQGPLQWFGRMLLKNSGDRLSTQSLWLEVATAPPGFAHLRNTVAGNVLRDIADGRSTDDIVRRVRQETDPRTYQRPEQNTAGNEAAFTRFIQEHKLERSLQRRFARLDEIEKLWPNKAGPPPAYDEEGPPRAEREDVRNLETPRKVTFHYFRSYVLPKAEVLEYMPGKRAHFGAYLTCVHADAPAILQWDPDPTTTSIEEEPGAPVQRNPFSLYTYVGPSLAWRWGLKENEWHRVNAVSLRPEMWYGREGVPGRSGPGVLFVVDNAKDIHVNSLCLFPECLKPAFHPFRASVEQYSKTHELAGRSDASVCGVLADTHVCDVKLRVTQAGVSSVFVLDRWE